jgi:hypothetical protein
MRRLMSPWCVALLPQTQRTRARVRWLDSDGRFTVASERAWTVVEPETAARRLQLWLTAHGRDRVRLQRLRLLPVSADDRAPTFAAASRPDLRVCA